PTGAGEAISGYRQEKEIASLPEPALSNAKGSLARTPSFFPHPDRKREAVFFESYQGHVIWGAMAMITVQLLDRIHRGGVK
ncbi:MAG: hypothetical protein WBM17_13515, partial [Anaerolineales bacterium]